MAECTTRVSVDAHAGAVVLRVSVCVDVDHNHAVLKQLQAPLTTAEARAVVVAMQRAIEEAERARPPCPALPPL